MKTYRKMLSAVLLLFLSGLSHTGNSAVIKNLYLAESPGAGDQSPAALSRQLQIYFALDELISHSEYPVFVVSFDNAYSEQLFDDFNSGIKTQFPEHVKAVFDSKLPRNETEFQHLKVDQQNFILALNNALDDPFLANNLYSLYTFGVVSEKYSYSTRLNIRSAFPDGVPVNLINLNKSQKFLLSKHGPVAIHVAFKNRLNLVKTVQYDSRCKLYDLVNLLNSVEVEESGLENWVLIHPNSSLLKRKVQGLSFQDLPLRELSRLPDVRVRIGFFNQLLDRIGRFLISLYY